MNKSILLTTQPSQTVAVILIELLGKQGRKQGRGEKSDTSLYNTNMSGVFARPPKALLKAVAIAQDFEKNGELFVPRIVNRDGVRKV